MTTTELQNIFKNASSNKNIAIVDVRSYMEREQISIPYTLHIPIDELENKIDNLRKFDDVYFFCKAGVRAEYATHIAQQSGIKAHTISNSVFEIMEIIS